MDEHAKTVWNTALEDQPLECWSNSILMRLAGALGYVDPLDENKPSLVVDPDALLEEAEFRLRWGLIPEDFEEAFDGSE